jgi:hypothetical protein
VSLATFRSPIRTLSGDAFKKFHIAQLAWVADDEHCGMERRRRRQQQQRRLLRLFVVVVVAAVVMSSSRVISKSSYYAAHSSMGSALVGRGGSLCRCRRRRRPRRLCSFVAH